MTLARCPPASPRDRRQFATSPTIRHKETDRLARPWRTELRRVRCGSGRVRRRPDDHRRRAAARRGGSKTYHDHRMAMSMALIGLKVPGDCHQKPRLASAKTYPGFFVDLGETTMRRRMENGEWKKGEWKPTTENPGVGIRRVLALLIGFFSFSILHSSPFSILRPARGPPPTAEMDQAL